MFACLRMYVCITSGVVRACMCAHMIVGNPQGHDCRWRGYPDLVIVMVAALVVVVVV